MHWLTNWLKSDVRLLKITEVEDIYRHNPFILTGYRDRTSVIGCLKSVLVLHNETINIWSHFLGFLFFVGLFCKDILWLIPQEQSEVTSSDFVVLCTLIICYQVSLLWNQLSKERFLSTQRECRHSFSSFKEMNERLNTLSASFYWTGKQSKLQM